MPAAVADLLGDARLAADGVDGDHHPVQRDQVQQLGDRRDALPYLAPGGGASSALDTHTLTMCCRWATPRTS